MSVVTRRKPRRLAPLILIAAGAVPFQHCALVAAVKLAALGITSLALGMPPAPVSWTDKHPICVRVMITYGNIVRRYGAMRGGGHHRVCVPG